MARAAANVSRLQLAMRIPPDTGHLRALGMCALSADEVLLTFGDSLRTVSLHTAQLSAHEPIIQYIVYGVEFDAHTDTLLLLVWPLTNIYGNSHDYDYFQLVSLRRNASEWLEVQRFDTTISGSFSDLNYISNFAVCDSRVLIGHERTLYVLEVSAEHTLRYAGSVPWQSFFYAVACTRLDGVTLVAFSHRISVSLLRLASLPLRLVPLASVSLTGPHELLFREDLLLVNNWNKAIVSFRVSDNTLTEQRVLLEAKNGVGWRAWALASDRLVLCNGKELLVYAFT